MVIVLVLLPSGCASHANHACTLVGCGSAVSVDPSAYTPPAGSAPLTAKLCVDQQCHEYPIPPTGSTGPLRLSIAASHGGTVSVSFELRTANGRDVLRATRASQLHKLQPNGPHCAPTCYDAALRLTAEGALVAAQPGGA
jgi:hypothetical protein